MQNVKTHNRYQIYHLVHDSHFIHIRLVSRARIRIIEDTKKSPKLDRKKAEVIFIRIEKTKTREKKDSSAKSN